MPERVLVVLQVVNTSNNKISRWTLRKGNKRLLLSTLAQSQVEEAVRTMKRMRLSFGRGLLLSLPSLLMMPLLAMTCLQIRLVIPMNIDEDFTLVEP